MTSCDIILITIPDYNTKPYLTGVASLSAFLKKHNKAPVCLDPITKFFEKSNHPRNIEQYLDQIVRFCLQEILQINCQYIGFSLLSPSAHIAIAIIDAIKGQNPNMKIVIGGPYVFTAQLESLQNVDFAIHGEGEIPLLKLLNLEPPETIPSLSYWVEGRHIPPRTNLSPINLSELPIPELETILPNSYYNEHYQKRIPVMFSRGCPGRCSFCLNHQISPLYRNFDVQQCLNYVAKFKNNQNTIIFEDPLCNGNQKWIEEWCAGLIERKYSINWLGSFRINSSLNDTTFLKLLFDSGCVGLLFGMESASKKVLKHMHKFHDPLTIYDIFEKLRNLKNTNNFFLHINVITGYPIESEEDHLQTLKFIRFNHDIINFVTVNECEIDKDWATTLQKEITLTHDGTRTGWTTDFSTPSIRKERASAIISLLEKLKISYATK